MNTQQSLRFRITFSFTAFSAILSGMIALGVLIMIDDIEREIIDEHVQNDLAYILKQENYRRDQLQKVWFDTQFYYHSQPNLPPKLPESLYQLPNGLHQWSSQDSNNYVLIQTQGQARLFLIKDATEFESREQTTKLALLLMVLTAISVGFFIGRTLASRVISPVTQLANQVAALDIKSSPPELSQHYADDEVGMLADAFKHYLIRLRQFIQREQNFTADASHELRTPLAVIQGAVELLQESKKLLPKEERQLDRIDRASKRMSQMLEVLLLLARENSQSNVSEQLLVQVSEVVAEIFDQFQHLLHNKTIVRDIQIKQDFTINSKRAILIILLGNIIKNAIEHTEQGKITIIIQEPSILVCDTGQGMSAETLQHLFERFFQANQHKEGNGIGLSIVKRICEQHGWKINVDSEIGIGTNFEIVFA